MKKRFKKAITVILIMAMAMSIGLPAFAQDTTITMGKTVSYNEDGTVRIVTTQPVVQKLAATRSANGDTQAEYSMTTFSDVYYKTESNGRTLEDDGSMWSYAFTYKYTFDYNESRGISAAGNTVITAQPVRATTTITNISDTSFAIKKMELIAGGHGICYNVGGTYQGYNDGIKYTTATSTSSFEEGAYVTRAFSNDYYYSVDEVSSGIGMTTHFTALRGGTTNYTAQGISLIKGNLDDEITP